MTELTDEQIAEMRRKLIKNIEATLKRLEKNCRKEKEGIRCVLDNGEVLLTQEGYVELEAGISIGELLIDDIPVKEVKLENKNDAWKCEKAIVVFEGLKDPPRLLIFPYP